MDRHMLFISEFIIIHFMICKAYQPYSHSGFHIVNIFKYAAAEISIQPSEQMLITRWRLILTDRTLRFITNKTALHVNVLYDTFVVYGYLDKRMYIFLGESVDIFILKNSKLFIE